MCVRGVNFWFQVWFTSHLTPTPTTLRSVTVLFADVCGFTEFSQVVEPSETLALLNELFSGFDSILKM